MTSGERIEAAWRSGELLTMAQGCRNMRELAAKFGVSQHAYRAVITRMRDRGLAVPRWEEMRSVEADDFSDEERTQPGVDYREPDTFIETSISAANQNEAPLPMAPCPGGFSIREVATQIDEDGNTEKQWLGARRDGEHFEDIQPSVPTGHHLRGISTLVDERGNVRAQWIKTATKQQQMLDAMIRALPALAEERLGGARSSLVEVPTLSNADLMAAYLVGDAHFGMHAWGLEAGLDFDLAIAERDLTIAVNHLVEVAPACDEALIVVVGDFVHADSKFGTTTQGTRLDVDTRWPKVIRCSLRTLRWTIDQALTKHKRVRVIIVPGNHDEHASILLCIALEQFYENNPRVEIDKSPDRYRWHRFGSNLIGVTHGHTAKPDRLKDVMTCDRARDWGETTHRHYYTGHVHHDSVKELAGVTVETIRTLATSDEWHWGQGYRSGHDMKCDVWHREYGRTGRNIVDLSEIRAKAA